MRVTPVPPAMCAGPTTTTFTDQQAQPLMMRFFALLVTWALLMSVLPISAWAADAPASEKTATEAVAALSASGYKPKPAYGKDTNVNDLVEAKLAALGFPDATARVLSSSNEAVSASNDASSPKANGEVTYFYHDPWDTKNFVWSVNANVTFEVTNAGTTAEWSSVSVINWDVAKAKAVMQERVISKLSAGDLATEASPIFDDSAASLSATKNLTLPKTINGQTWTKVTWKSSDTSVLVVTDPAYGVPFAGTIVRGAQDKTVTLTATFDFNKTGILEPAISLTKNFRVTVLGYSAEEVASREQELLAILDKCTLATIESVSPKAPIDPAAVTSDFNFPATRIYRTADNKALDGKIYKLAYRTSDSAAVTVNTFRGNVFQPLPGEDPSRVTLFVSLAKDGITTEKEIGTIVLPPLTTAELDREVALMGSAKLAFFDGIKGANTSSDAITKNLSSVTQYRENADSSRTWVTSLAAKSGLGIIPAELEGWYGSEQWRLFKSSNPSVISHESLRVIQPQYDTVVRIDSALTSERFASYAARFPSNPYIAKLVNQPVSATVKVLGTDGPNPNPADSVAITNQVVGLDGDGASSLWIPKSDQNFAPGTSAWDASIALFEKYGFTHEGSAGFLNSISKPDGTKLGFEADGDNYKFWAFYINGQMADVGAASYFLKEGDSIAWVYFGGDQTGIPASDVATTPDAPRPDYSAFWPAFGRGQVGAGSVTGSTGPVVEAPAPTTLDTTELAWKYRFGKIDSADPYSEIANGSDLLIVNDELFIASARGVYNPDWSSTYTSSQLDVLDRTTGAVKRTVKLAAPVDSTCRPVYAEGLIIVPLLGGRLQAFTADTLTCVWVTDAIETSTGATQKPLSSMTVHDGHIFVGMTSGWGDAEGVLQSVNLNTGAISWRTTYPRGFYWAGSTIVASPGGSDTEKFLASGGDDGIISLIDPATGLVKSTLAVGGQVRSALVAQGSDLYFMTFDGIFHKLSVTGEGTLIESGSVTLAGASDDSGDSASTSTPTIYNGRAYVGGRLGGQGVLAVIDLSTMKVIDSVTVEGQIQSAPLVVLENGKVHAYFTANADRGGVYCYSAESGSVEEIFVPEDALKNYTFSSVIAGPDGALYYTNDSGTLFALQRVATPVKPANPVTPAKPTDPVTPAAPTAKPAKPAAGKTASSAKPGATASASDKDAPTDEPSLEPTQTLAGGEPEATALQERPLERGLPTPAGSSAQTDQRSPLENKLRIAFAALIALAVLSGAGIVLARRKRLGGVA